MHLIGARTIASACGLGLSGQRAWLARSFVLAFALPFLLADLFEINRDVFYGLYAIAVLGLIGLWARSTGSSSSPLSSGAGCGQSDSAVCLLPSWHSWFCERRTPPPDLTG